jgi:hypothetical protein
MGKGLWVLGHLALFGGCVTQTAAAPTEGVCAAEVEKVRKEDAAKIEQCVAQFAETAKKAKSIEPKVHLKWMFDWARIYYEELGGKREKKFPTPSAGPTPPLGTCCKQPRGRCEANSGLWAKPPWTSLRMALDDPHYYSYQYEVAPDGRSFTARAMGDLDCNGVYSTFELVGSISADGTVTGPAGMFINNELE